MGFIDDQLISCNPWIPASPSQVQAASSVVISCRLNHIRRKSELPSSEMIWVEISGLPVPPVLPVSAKAPYTLAIPDVYPAGVEYTAEAVMSLVGFRSSVFLQEPGRRTPAAAVMMTEN